MPPKVSPQQYSIVTPLTPLLSPLSPKSQVRKPLQHTCCSKGVGKMKITKKRLIPVLVCILSIASIIRLIKIAKVTSSSALPLSQLQNPAGRASDDQPTVHSTASALTEKEMRFLADIVSYRAPCNLLVFGIERQYLTLASINAGGLTIFLEDEPSNIKCCNLRQLGKVFTHTISLLTPKLKAISRHVPCCSARNMGALITSSLHNPFHPLLLTCC